MSNKSRSSEEAFAKENENLNKKQSKFQKALKQSEYKEQQTANKDLINKNVENTKKDIENEKLNISNAKEINFVSRRFDKKIDVLNTITKELENVANKNEITFISPIERFNESYLPTKIYNIQMLYYPLRVTTYRRNTNYIYPDYNYDDNFPKFGEDEIIISDSNKPLYELEEESRTIYNNKYVNIPFFDFLSLLVNDETIKEITENIEELNERTHYTINRHTKEDNQTLVKLDKLFDSKTLIGLYVYNTLLQNSLSKYNIKEGQKYTLELYLRDFAKELSKEIGFFESINKKDYLFNENNEVNIVFHFDNDIYDYIKDNIKLNIDNNSSYIVNFLKENIDNLFNFTKPFQKDFAKLYEIDSKLKYNSKRNILLNYFTDLTNDLREINSYSDNSYGENYFEVKDPTTYVERINILGNKIKNIRKILEPDFFRDDFYNIENFHTLMDNKTSSFINGKKYFFNSLFDEEQYDKLFGNDFKQYSNSISPNYYNIMRNKFAEQLDQYSTAISNDFNISEYDSYFTDTGASNVYSIISNQAELTKDDLNIINIKNILHRAFPMIFDITKQEKFFSGINTEVITSPQNELEPILKYNKNRILLSGLTTTLTNYYIPNIKLSKNYSFYNNILAYYNEDIGKKNIELFKKYFKNSFEEIINEKNLVIGKKFDSISKEIGTDGVLLLMSMDSDRIKKELNDNFEKLSGDRNAQVLLIINNLNNYLSFRNKLNSKLNKYNKEIIQRTDEYLQQNSNLLNKTQDVIRQKLQNDKLSDDEIELLFFYKNENEKFDKFMSSIKDKLSEISEDTKIKENKEIENKIKDIEKVIERVIKDDIFTSQDINSNLEKSLNNLNENYTLKDVTKDEMNVSQTQKDILENREDVRNNRIRTNLEMSNLNIYNREPFDSETFRTIKILDQLNNGILKLGKDYIKMKSDLKKAKEEDTTVRLEGNNTINAEQSKELAKSIGEREKLKNPEEEERVNRIINENKLLIETLEKSNNENKVMIDNLNNLLKEKDKLIETKNKNPEINVQPIINELSNVVTQELSGLQNKLMINSQQKQIITSKLDPEEKKSLLNDLSNLNLRAGTVLTTISNNSNDLMNHIKEITNNIEGSISDQSTNIEEINNQINRLGEFYNNLGTHFNEQNQNIDNINNELDSLNKGVSDINTILKEKQIATITDDDLRKFTDSVDASLKNLSVNLNIDDLNYTQNLDTINDNIGALYNRIENIFSKIDELKDNDNSEMINVLNDLKNQVDSIQKENNKRNEIREDIIEKSFEKIKEDPSYLTATVNNLIQNKYVTMEQLQEFQKLYNDQTLTSKQLYEQTSKLANDLTELYSKNMKEASEKYEKLSQDIKPLLQDNLKAIDDRIIALNDTLDGIEKAKGIKVKDNPNGVSSQLYEMGNKIINRLDELVKENKNLGPLLKNIKGNVIQEIREADPNLDKLEADLLKEKNKLERRKELWDSTFNDKEKLEKIKQKLNEAMMTKKNEMTEEDYFNKKFSQSQLKRIFEFEPDFPDIQYTDVKDLLPNSFFQQFKDFIETNTKQQKPVVKLYTTNYEPTAKSSGFSDNTKRKLLKLYYYFKDPRMRTSKKNELPRNFLQDLSMLSNFSEKDVEKKYAQFLRTGFF